MKQTKTKVIFRKDRTGRKEVFALFPEELGTSSPYTCSCYQHVGQHCSADPQGCIQRSVSAKPSEYRELAIELRNYGPTEAHYRLQIVKRIPRNALKVRRAKLEALR